jgi:NitT/TauT family transport system ATP-binding protein
MPEALAVTQQNSVSREVGSEQIEATAVASEGFSFEFEFQGVSREFVSRGKTFTAVSGIDLAIKRGTFNCIIGPSGCGKSTLLNMAAGLMEPTDGVVLHRGRPVTKVNRDVGYMTQQSLLLPWRNLERNVCVPLEIRGTPRRERKERVAEMLKKTGLEGFEHRYPSQLSGGMQKRAALARTLIYDPDTLLMNEPFGALDAQLKLTLQRELLQLWERDKRTVMFVTHDLEEAMLLGDQIIVFGTKPGRIIHVEPINFERPRDLVHLRGTPDFSSTWERLWRLLEPRAGAR